MYRRGLLMRKFLIVAGFLVVLGGCAETRYGRGYYPPPPGYRYQDRHYRDYHVWGPDEDRAWGRYRNERRIRGDFHRMNRREQERYWKWRHEHQEHR